MLGTRPGRPRIRLAACASWSLVPVQGPWRRDAFPTKRNRTTAPRPTSRLTCALELTRGIAGHVVALHAGFAYVNTLVQLPHIIARVTLDDARALLFVVFYFLRT